MVKNIKRHYKHYLAVALLLAIASLAIPYWTSLQRLWETLVDLAISIAYYCCEFAHLLWKANNPITPTVNSFSQVIDIDILLPQTWEATKILISEWWALLWNSQNATVYLAKVSKGLGVVVLMAMTIMPLLVLLNYLLMRNLTAESDAPAGHQTKALVTYIRLYNKVCKPTNRWLRNYARFLADHKAYLIIGLALLAIVTNVLSIAVSIVAHILYFSVSVDMSSIWMILYRFIVDITYALTGTLPRVVWIVIIAVVIAIISRHIGLERLRNFINKNKLFLMLQDLVLFINGTMGKGKTTLITDMAITYSEIYRDKAYEGMFDNASKFQSFPWRNLEIALEKAVASRQVTTLYSIDDWVKSHYIAHRYVFGYDKLTNKVLHRSGLKLEWLLKVLIAYAKQYFIYAVAKDLIIANYSIRRLSKCKVNNNNLMMYDHDYVTMELAGFHEQYCHILDFDILRFGKTLDNKNAGRNYEFGILVATEIGKERGNSLENAGKKKVADEANQKNDLFNYALSFIRHRSTIDGVPYARFICDEQRPERWGADARQLTTIMTIDKKSDPKLALPNYWPIELLVELSNSMYRKLYKKYRSNRSDDCLPMYLLRSFFSSVYLMDKRIQSGYRYIAIDIRSELGSEGGEVIKGKYYLVEKKIYSNVFATDCYADILNKCDKDALSINDIPYYKNVKPSSDEFMSQNSYIINDLDSLSK